MGSRAPLVPNIQGTASTANGPNPSISLAFRVTGHQLARSTLSSSLQLIRGECGMEEGDELRMETNRWRVHRVTTLYSWMKQAARL